jgi:hypothetical protein
MRIERVRSNAAWSEYAVRCPNHQVVVHFVVSALQMELTRLSVADMLTISAATAIKDHCPSCVELFRRGVMPATRWPEDAEL